MINKEMLKKQCEKMNIILEYDALERFDIYAETLIEWNSFMNLTAITQPDEIVTKHFTDSLSLLGKVKIEKASKIIDVGTGAGFPGLALKIARNDLDITLMDSTNKRLEFIKEVLKKTSLQCEVIHSRAEDLGKNPNYREKYDYATARAVANLRDLAEYCLPFVKVGGYFVPMKSAKAKEELETAEKAIKVLGGKVENISSFNLNEAGERSIFIIKKISQTPTKYPRVSAKMAKFPIE